MWAALFSVVNAEVGSARQDGLNHGKISIQIKDKIRLEMRDYTN
jgi:hypothetical protein